MTARQELFGIEFWNGTLSQAVDALAASAELGKRVLVQTVNVDHLVLREKNRDFRRSMDAMDMITPDGMPIVWASRILHRPLMERVTGADIITELITHRLSVEGKLRFFFLGSTSAVCRRAADEARKLNPRVRVVGSYSPSALELMDQTSTVRICTLINESQTNVLLVALGAPKQELWITRHCDVINPGVIVGVGAGLDFLARAVPRAPIYLRQLGLEWLYRLLREPKRLWRRYLVRDSAFLRIFLRETFSQLSRWWHVNE